MLMQSGFDVTLLDRPGPNFRNASAWLHHQESLGRPGTASWQAFGWDIDEAQGPPELALWAAGAIAGGPSIVIAAEVVEHLRRPRRLLRVLRRLLAPGGGAVAAVLTTPDRDAWYDRRYHLGPPHNPAHVREWNATEFVRFLACEGLPPIALLEVGGALVAMLGSEEVVVPMVAAALWDSPAALAFHTSALELAAPPPPEWLAPRWRRLL
mmetsp:Transcript_126749/g.405862  ORF Transcript_126749/g.405862 Transcript_126749/m.405862 type:complete len:210 (+) Transcript_126749:557-1186(+)